MTISWCGINRTDIEYRDNEGHLYKQEIFDTDDTAFEDEPTNDAVIGIAITLVDNYE